MAKSKLQIAAQKRNSAKGRIKGLRNNIRGMLSDDSTPLTSYERESLENSEDELNRILMVWDDQWERLKSEL